MIIKNKEQLDTLKEAGKILRTVLDEVENIIKEGISTNELNEKAVEVMRHYNVEPSFLNYKPDGHSRPYPAAICASVNEEVVHGIPNELPRVLKAGDIITIDSGVWLNNICTDSARTIAVGSISLNAKKLIDVAIKIRDAQINTAKTGTQLSELGKVVEDIVKKYGFHSPHILGGHGVGAEVHEAPFVPSFYDSYSKYKLKEGEVLAFEPIVIEGTGQVELQADGYTYVSKDKSLSAQFEHTVVIWNDGAEIIT